MKPTITHTDGLLYVGMAICTTATAISETSDAVQFISPPHLFAIRSLFEVAGAACLAAKTYRSTTFANKQAQDADANVISSEKTTVEVAGAGQPAKTETVTEKTVPPPTVAESATVAPGPTKA